MEHEDLDFLKSVFLESSQVDVCVLLKDLVSSKSLPSVRKFSLFLEDLSSFGVGKFSLKRVSEHQVHISVENLVLSKLYKNIYGSVPPLSLEYLPAGFCKHAAELLFQKEVLEVSLEKNLICLELGEEKNFVLEKSPYVLEEQHFHISPVLLKILSQKQIKISSGLFSIWNTYGILVPYASLFSFLSRFDTSYYETFFEKLGVMQGRAAATLQSAVFGVHSDELFERVIEQSQLVGMGRVLYYWETPFRFLIETNCSSSFSPLRLGSSLFYLYLCGIIKGVYEFCTEQRTLLSLRSREAFLEKCPVREDDDEEREIDVRINAKALLAKSCSLASKS
ncbi:hypothetical protein H6501_00335 [Candidatus Woesearchaeota archaeon]|nr:hypothetical protein [Candidatus Woesearchaeota archaeon]